MNVKESSIEIAVIMDSVLTLGLAEKYLLVSLDEFLTEQDLKS